MEKKWNSFIPKRIFGNLSPLGRVKYEPYSFYRLAPPDVLSIYMPMGLAEFSAADVERVFEPIDELIQQCLDNECDIIIQGGAPLPILIGTEAHDRLMDHIAEKSGLPVTSSVTAVCRAARHMGITNIVVANKWSDDMNRVLGEFFAREGVKLIGTCNESMTPAKFLKMNTADGMDLAYELGSRAIKENPGCDGLYVGGGAWLVPPIVDVLEQEFGLPCISNQDSQIWDALHKVNYWKPRRGFNRLLASD
jgi:maleate cis-trans isomerase